MLTLDEMKKIAGKNRPQAMTQSPTKQESSGIRGYAERALENPYIGGATNFALGWGDALRNQMGALAETATGYKPPMPKMGEGTAYDIGGFGGEIQGFLGGGGLLKQGVKGLSKTPGALGKGAQWLSGEGMIPAAARGITGGTAAGYALSPDEPQRGASEGAFYSAIGEAFPFATKAAGKFGEAISNTQYTKDIMESMRNYAKETASEAGGMYKQVFDKFGKTRIDKPHISASKEVFVPENNFKNYIGEIQDGANINEYFSPASNRLKREFLRSPTLNKAHLLQSQLAKNARQLESRGAPLNEIEHINEARQLLLKDISNALTARSPEFADIYAGAKNIYGQKYSQFLNEKYLRNIKEGGHNKMNAEQLLDKLLGSTTGESAKISGNHYISGLIPELQKKVNRSKLYSPFSEKGPLNKLFGVDVGAVLSNPEGIELVKAMEKLYDPASKAFVATNIGRKE